MMLDQDDLAARGECSILGGDIFVMAGVGFRSGIGQSCG